MLFLESRAPLVFPQGAQDGLLSSTVDGDQNPVVNFRDRLVVGSIPSWELNWLVHSVGVCDTSFLARSYSKKRGFFQNFPDFWRLCPKMYCRSWTDSNIIHMGNWGIHPAIRPCKSYSPTTSDFRTMREKVWVLWYWVTTYCTLERPHFRFFSNRVPMYCTPWKASKMTWIGLVRGLTTSEGAISGITVKTAQTVAETGEFHRGEYQDRPPRGAKCSSRFGSKIEARYLTLTSTKLSRACSRGLWNFIFV